MTLTPDMSAASILGMGVQLPRAVMSSRELDVRLGRPPGWLERSCGVRQRHVASDDESQEAMGTAAARAALDDAGIDGASIDLLLFAAAVGRQPIPATAPLIKRELGLDAHAFPAYDINATCLSALVAMDIAALHIAAGRARRVLIVASEIASRAMPWSADPRTAGLFGDGAAALVIGSGDKPHMRLGCALIETYAAGYDHCQLAAGGTRYDFHREPAAFADNSFFAMDGRALYELTSREAPGFIARLLDRAGWRQEDVDLVVPHQASPHALAHIVKRCGFAESRVIDLARDLGNQVAASLPIALHHARATGRIERGMKILLLGTSAGVSLGGVSLIA